MQRDHLRPLERAVLARVDEGLSLDEVAARFKMGPAHLERVIAYTELPGRQGPPERAPGALRPLERRVLSWRQQGLSHEEIGAMFRRSAAHVRRVEGLAYLRKGRHLLAG